jgi:hypothetical protein
MDFLGFPEHPLFWNSEKTMDVQDLTRTASGSSQNARQLRPDAKFDRKIVCDKHRHF